jgi:hypothetical protein
MPLGAIFLQMLHRLDGLLLNFLNIRWIWAQEFPKSLMGTGFCESDFALIYFAQLEQWDLNEWVHKKLISFCFTYCIKIHASYSQKTRKFVM